MIMIPLPFVMAMVAIWVMMSEWTRPSQRRYWLLWFLGVLAFQELLVGARFGYGLDDLKLIQPLSAAALPPLAYLSFARPKLAWPVLIHSLPVMFILLILAVFIDIMDVFLAANNLFYTVGLVLIGIRGSDALAWAAVGRTRTAGLMLWVVVLVLLVSGLADALISADFIRAGGANIGQIVGWTSLFGLILAVVLGGVIWVMTRRGKSVLPDQTQDKAVFERLQTLMQTERLFIDPDISLSRIARRLGLPVRSVSRAINAQIGLNVSQYVNDLRITEACQLLSESEIKITEVIYASGYNTKSNFNREFLRVTGKTPSVWRQDKA